MRLILPLALAFATLPTVTMADTLTGHDWELLAVDGGVVDYSATLRVDENGRISGKAPCNSWSTGNAATLPEVKLQGIRATRMACDQMAEETAFFLALSQMDRLELDGTRNVVLTGPDGRSMEFVFEIMNSLTVCKTCPPKE